MKKVIPLLLVAFILLTSMACQFSGSIPAFDLGESETDHQETVEEPTPTLQPTVQVPVYITNSDSMEITLTELYNRVSPGVVFIQTLDEMGGVQGSGFVYDTEGHIITNYHVVEGAQDMEVDFPSGLKVHGEVVGIDTDSDIAVIKVDVPSEDLVPIPLGDSEVLQVGQFVVAIGNPYGLSSTMTMGVVSAKGRTLSSIRETEDGRYFSAGDLIQTDASINPGNSGGPLLNLQGQVIGINRAIQTSGISLTGDPVNTGIGFAVSINIVKRVVPFLISQGYYDYPYMGLSCLEEISLMQSEALGLSQATGAYIVEVVEGGPADQAGMIAGRQATEISGLYAGGDLIIGVDGRPVQVFGDLLSYIMTSKSPGETITLSILRNNREEEVMLTLDRRP